MGRLDYIEMADSYAKSYLRDELLDDYNVKIKKSSIMMVN